MNRKILPLILFCIIITPSSPTGGAVNQVSPDQVQVALGQASQPHPRLFISDQQLPGVIENIQASAEILGLFTTMKRSTAAR